MTAPVLEIQSVSKTYRTKAVLRDLSLQLFPGEIYGLFGSNGSGKSTLLRIAAGALRPTAGSVRVRGTTGYVAQKFSLYPDLTVEENLAFFARCYDVTAAEARARVDRTVDRVGLSPYRTHRADELSHGWRQRLSLAAALTHSPALLLLDEATAGLDPGARASLWRLLSDFAAGGGAILLATHFADEGERCALAARIEDGALAPMVFA
jgi:ABC-type multidrug transport system ATPase subunit